MSWWRLQSGSNIVIVIVMAVGIVIAYLPHKRSTSCKTTLTSSTSPHCTEQKEKQYMQAAFAWMSSARPKEVKYIHMEIQAGMCEKSRVATALPRNYRKTPQEPMKHDTEAALAWTSSHPPPSLPMYRTTPHQNKVNKRNTRQTPHSHGRRQPPPPPPHPDGVFSVEDSVWVECLPEARVEFGSAL